MRDNPAGCNDGCPFVRRAAARYRKIFFMQRSVYTAQLRISYMCELEQSGIILRLLQCSEVVRAVHWRGLR